MTDDSDSFDWGALGEARWRELGETTGASHLQLRFAVARFSGASATRAAKLAGYSGDSDALRRAGYSAVRSTAVQNLLELAAINAPGDAKISEKEIDAKISKLIRSADSNVSLKAMELHAKREAAQKEAQASGETTDFRQVVDECFKLNGIYVAPCVAGWWKHFVLGAPYFELYASFLKRRFPELWEQYRDPLLRRSDCGERDCLKTFDELGDRPELTDDQFRAALTIKGMTTNAA